MNVFRYLLEERAKEVLNALRVLKLNEFTIDYLLRLTEKEKYSIERDAARESLRKVIEDLEILDYDR